MPINHKVVIKRSPLFEVRVRVQMATGVEFAGTTRLRAKSLTAVLDADEDETMGLSEADHAVVQHAMEHEPDSVRLLEITVERMDRQ